MKTGKTPFVVSSAAFLLLICLLSPLRAAVSRIDITGEQNIAADERQDYARYVRFRPGDGEAVTLNPPRFSWPYEPGIVFKNTYLPASRRFTLQISAKPDFAKPYIEVKGTDCNFYNFLGELKGDKVWYWRVGYGDGGKIEQWSRTRKFTIADGATVWDRSNFQKTIDGISGHPRILFNEDNKKQVLGMRERDPYCERIADYIIRSADGVLKQRWYRDFPAKDTKPMSYMGMSQGLVFVGFAYLLTEDEKYLSFKERLLTMASWPKGGESGPEGCGGVNIKWNTHLTEHMGLLYDWFYHDLSIKERAVIRGSLEWRLDWTLNNYAWLRDDGQKIRSSSIAAMCSSHSYQNIMAIIPGALAICDESKVAKKALEIGMHYMVGITNGHGEDEAWMDGPGYGNGKMKWLMNAASCLQASVPLLELGRNEVIANYADFFARVTPMGVPHSSFGNRGRGATDWMGSRIHNFRRVAMLTSSGQAMQNWIDTQEAIKKFGSGASFSRSPYIDYALSYYLEVPAPKMESDFSKVFEIEGWVSVSSAAPSSYESQKKAVSMVFTCRPRGGYGHSFPTENAFDIHAFGQTIAAGGGNTHNSSDFARDSMSHNTILVNGLGQLASRNANIKSCGRIVAYEERDNYIYFAGDATAAYGEKTGLGKFIRHVVFVDNSYFVVFDELEMADKAKAGTFQWLYHIPNYAKVKFDKENFAIDYTIENASVRVQHLANTSDLAFDKYQGDAGYLNRITGKDYRQISDSQQSRVDRKTKYNVSEPDVRPATDAVHLWISHKTPRKKMNFLSVIVPYKKGQSPPAISRVSERAARVKFGGEERIISFDGLARN